MEPEQDKKETRTRDEVQDDINSAIFDFLSLQFTKLCHGPSSPM